jgi:hypothetical protein
MNLQVRSIALALMFGFACYGMPGGALAQVWSLEKTPARLRPGLCADLRKVIDYDLNTSSYKFAMKRKQEGTAWQKHKKRLAYSENLQDSYRRLDCRHY